MTMTNSSEEFLIPKSGIKNTCEHFANLLGMGEEAETLRTTWFEPMKSLMKSAQMQEEPFCAFLSWAVNDNTSDIGGMNSVEYLGMAKDKMGSLSKNFPNLMRVYNVKLKVAGVKRRSSIPPLPLKLAGWLMDGFGVNEPSTGWQTGREKLDAIKRSWYGIGWESQPDPDIPWEAKFAQFQSTFRIIKDEDEVQN
jgi:hypothetical protein